MSYQEIVLEKDDSTAEKLLMVENLIISYKNNKTGNYTEAVKDVSLHINRGEFVTIVGLSGCGKSSFLNAVAGLVEITSGAIKINNRKVKGPGQDRAVVFQKSSLLPWKTTINNIIYGLELNGVPKKEALKRAEKYVEMTKLKGFEKYYPSTLSGGMQQRVNLARALVVEPEILLLDEPFAALDAITREEMQNELLVLWEKTKKTVLMVTHQIDEAILLSDRVIVLSARPANIVADIRINLERPRTLDVKNNPLFDALAQKIWNYIHNSSQKKGDVEYEI
ncbi:ABC transporter ATP-binding protein [Metabacillus fastidiosus]|uniref:ABC transporter ATP-binding protein n=1 Tax=Metabacillus fastidiosus TaxID=1458 RepID=UPI0009ECCD0D|nr:ABC transporter ATP-binding protein [Metabacillus fastidiosus]MED4464590.1 ABC transporter ATP-binding protein [Metabacillus fastidiosus]